MLTFSNRLTFGLAIVFSIAMWATRGHHFASLSHLPDASWAIFFLVGFYLRRQIWLPAFLAQAALIDCLAITQDGVSNYCMTPAYIFLLPAYASLWLAGRWYAGRFKLDIPSMGRFIASATISAFACEVISSGSFYFLGGRFTDTSLAEFFTRLVKYFPSDLAVIALYLGCAALVHLLIVNVHGMSSRATQ
jgi:hypothetical protein